MIAFPPVFASFFWTLLQLMSVLFFYCSAAEAAMSLQGIQGRAYYVFDVDSQQTLTQFNETLELEPASLTKLMTAYLTFKALKAGQLQPHQTIHASEKAWKTEGSRMFLDPKYPVSVEDLLKGLIVQSGNDAALTLAEMVAGNEAAFVQKMNQEAARLGMKKTVFKNATGLPEAGHYSTALDLGRLATAIVTHFPEFYPLYSIRSFKYNKVEQKNRNLLLWRDSFVDGLKTGHTESAGYCLIASTHEQGRRVISVLLGASSEEGRANETQKLLQFGIKRFDTRLFFKDDESLFYSEVLSGKSNTVAVGVPDTVYLTVKKGRMNAVQRIKWIQPHLQAPIQKGQVLGHLTLQLEGEVLKKVPLIALHAVEEGSLFKRLKDSIRQFLGLVSIESTVLTT